MRLEGQPVATPNVIVDGADVVNHGVIEGNGRIQASLENHGTLRPGLSAGALRFEAGFELASDGLVEIEIGGATPLTEYDRIIVNQFGTATLAGDLLVSLIDGFVPDADATFTILTAGVVAGTFDHELKSGLPPGLNYKVNYNPGSVELALFAGFTADFSGDGVVDENDLAKWQGSFGVDAGGDADGDGDTDGGDLLLWQQQLGGMLAAPSGNVVPEPKTDALILLVALASILFARAQCKRMGVFARASVRRGSAEKAQGLSWAECGSSTSTTMTADRFAAASKRLPFNFA
jgi:hypothetical protein